MADLDPNVLELLREQSGLSIDLEGRFLHQGEPITHERTLEVLWRSLERNERGRYQVRVGREVGYVTLADAPYGVRGVTWDEAERPILHLTDGSAEPLAPDTLSVGPDGVLRCLVKAGEHRARFGRAAQVALGLALTEDASSPGGYALRVGDRSFVIPTEEPGRSRT